MPLPPPYQQVFLAPGFEAETQGAPHRFLQHCDFPEVNGVVPRASGTRWEESHVAGTKPALLTALICHDSFARQHEDSLVLIVGPSVTSWSAFPPHDALHKIVCPHKHFAPRLRGATQYPFRGDRGGLEFNTVQGSGYDAFRHRFSRWVP